MPRLGLQGFLIDWLNSVVGCEEGAEGGKRVCEGRGDGIRPRVDKNVHRYPAEGCCRSDEPLMMGLEIEGGELEMADKRYCTVKSRDPNWPNHLKNIIQW